MSNNSPSISQNIYRLVDWFIPPSLLYEKHNEDTLRRYRLLIGISLLKGVLWAGMVLFVLAFTREYGVYEVSFLTFFLVMSLMSIFLPLNLRRTNAYRATIMIDWILTRLVILVMVFVTGGLTSPNLIWLMMGPMVTLVFLGARASLFDMVVVITCILGFRILGANVVIMLPQEIQMGIINVVAILATTFLTLIVLFFESAHERTQAQLEAVLTDLQVTNHKLSLANEKALAATKAKSEFLANMSHEIRTPLNTVIGMTNMLLETPQSGEQREFTEMVHSSGEALLSLISDILDLSKIEAGKLELEKQPFDLHQCVELATAMLAASAEEKGLTLLVTLAKDVPRIVLGDETRLRQVLINLLSNAVKFTSEGEIVVSVKRASAVGSDYQLQFSVKDSGIGIPAEGIVRLFQSFSQGDSSTTRQYGGTGLGLAISKQLVDLMGGTIWVESEEGIGSDFQFTIQLQALDSEEPWGDNQHREQEATVPRATVDELTLSEKKLGQHHPLRILVAEDNSLNQKVIVTMLAKLGYQADVVENGLEVWQAVRSQSYDLILMDIRMPEMDGIEASGKLRNMLGERPYIIAISAYALQENKTQCLQAGMNDFLSKPIRMPELIEALKRCPTQAEHTVNT